MAYETLWECNRPKALRSTSVEHFKSLEIIKAAIGIDWLQRLCDKAIGKSNGLLTNYDIALYSAIKQFNWHLEISMSNHPLGGFVCVPISLSVYCRVLEKFGDRANGLIETVVEDYLERTADDDFAPLNSSEGLYWDRLFLVDGTRLRTKHHGNYQYAQVVGDKVAFEDTSFPSVAKAVNRMRNNVPSNAWKVVEVNRPNDSQWVHAESLRRKAGI